MEKSQRTLEMRGRRRWLFQAAGLIACLALTFSSATAQAQQLRIQSGFPKGVFGDTAAYESLAQAIGAQARFYPGEVVPAGVLLQSVTSGNPLNVGWQRTSLGEAADSALRTLGEATPGMSAITYVQWRSQPDVEDIAGRLYAKLGLKGMLCGVMADVENGLWMKRPLPSAANSLKGVRLRTPANMVKDVLAGIGASSNFLPLGEVVPALERGVLDGSVSSFPELDMRGRIENVAKYFYQLDLAPVSGIDLLVNLKVWQEMKEDRRAAIVSICQQLSRRMAAEPAEKALQRMREAGVQVGPLPKAMNTALQRAAEVVAGNLAKENSAYKMLAESRTRTLALASGAGGLSGTRMSSDASVPQVSAAVPATGTADTALRNLDLGMLWARSAMLGESQMAEADRLFSTGYQLWENRDYRGAVEVLRKGLDIDPANGQANYYMGDSLQNLGNVVQARIHLQRAVNFGSCTLEHDKAREALQSAAMRHSESLPEATVPVNDGSGCKG